jgi:hypothetical protein
MPRHDSPTVTARTKRRGVAAHQWTASSLVKALLPDSHEHFADPDDARRQRGFWPLAYARLERS